MNRKIKLSNKDTLVIWLRGHEAIIAALILCDRIGNDNKAVVMMKGYGGDDDYSGVYLTDYDLNEIIDDPSWFDDYENPQIWVERGIVCMA